MEKTIGTIQKISLRGDIIALDAGDMLRVPIGVRSYSYTRHVAAMVGMERGRKYGVHINRAAGVFEITRHE